jgi:hypothetical protein
MPIQVTRMTEADIDGAIDTIQQAFAEDPYNLWIYPDRSKVPHPRMRTYNTPTNTTSDRSNPQSRLPHPPLPLGHPPRPLPRRPRHLQPHQNPRLRNVDATSPTLHSRTLVALPFLLVPMVLPDPHESHIRPWRALHKALLDMEGTTSGGAKRAVDEREGVLLL